VEGELAGGSAFRQGRDRRFQAILPLARKILNLENATWPRSTKNTDSGPINPGLGLGHQRGRSSTNRPAFITARDHDRRRCGWRPHRTLLLTFFLSLSKKLFSAERWLHLHRLPAFYKVEARVKITYCYITRQDSKQPLDGFWPARPITHPAFQGPGRNDAKQSGKPHGSNDPND